MPSSALVAAAREALLAALLVDEPGLATLLAEITDLAPLVGARGLGGSAGLLQLSRVLGQRARERVRQRQDLAGAEAHRLGAADARELADDLLESALSRQRRRQPQCERNETSERLGHRHRVGAALADLDEDLERLALGRLVDRDEGRPDRRLHAIGLAGQAVRPRLDDDLSGRRQLRGPLVFLADADVQDLLALAAVAEDGDA